MSGLGNLGKNFEDVVAPVAAMVLLHVPPVGATLIQLQVEAVNHL